MYSIVLMMALSTSGDTPAFGGRGCHGCNGCYGNACHGGNGCHGCWGGRHRRHGCHGCDGYACHGCRGYAHGYAHGCRGYAHGCHGYACHGCHGGVAVPVPMPVPAPKKEGGKAIGSLEAAPATIVVSLPAEAKLTVDDAVTQSTSSTRVFATPALERGKDYYYTLKAEIIRDGSTLTANRRVQVRAGEETRVTLDVPVATVAQK